MKQTAGQMEREAGSGRSLVARVRRFVNSETLDHELTVVIASYVFVFAGAWNDGLLGLPPSEWSDALQWVMATVLVLEILSRILFTRPQNRKRGFYPFLALDIVSVMTVVPALTGFALARLGRLAYASWRMVQLFDKEACKKRQPMYLIGIYPLVLPLSAALLFAVERNSAHPAVKTYLDAFGMTVGFALTLGSDRPHTYAGNIICGILFLGGIICLGIISNSLTGRYQESVTSAETGTHH
jgi:hypothetical protein